jgi:DNA polymerase II small subunit/DNA polymerase delta subunit B
MKIYSDDGKEFKNVQECNAYEADLKARREKEEAERKERQKKVEEERKRAKEIETSLLDEINGDYKKLSTKIKEFENKTGRKVIYTHDYVSGEGLLTSTKNTFDYTWDYPLQRFVNSLFGEK